MSNIKQLDRHQTGGADGRRGRRGPVGTSPKIRERDKPFTMVIVPILAIVSCLLLFSIFTKYFSVDCSNYFMLKLVYPLFFGAAGVVLGGAVSVKGHFKIFGLPWAAEVVGAIGAALIGFGITAYAEPKCPAGKVQPKLSLHVANVPIMPPNELATPRYFVTVDHQSNVDVKLEEASSSGATGTLVFSFLDKRDFAISLRLYKLIDNKHYEYMGTCEVQFQYVMQPAISTPEAAVYSLNNEFGWMLKFDRRHFARLEDARSSATVEDKRNLCLQGMFAEEGKIPELNHAITPLKIAPVKEAIIVAQNAKLINMFFTRSRPALPANPAEAVRKVAQVDIATSSEVLNTSGTEAVARSTSAPTSSLTAAPPPSRSSVTSAPDVASSTTGPATNGTPRITQSPINCAAPTNQLLLDQFLAGNDLEKNQRQRLYGEWGGIRCYVLSRAFPTPSAQVSSLEQSRAIRLLLNVIVNTRESQTASAYWQPGIFKRDFGRPLPSVVSEADLKKIFELLTADDDLVRAEAIRFIRNLPVDLFEKLFRERKTRLNELPMKARERYAIGASFFYYNRIVEWLSARPEADKTNMQQAINAGWNAGRAWTQDAFFVGKSAKPYEAILMYAKGIVERERKLTDDQGRSSFATMLTALRAAGDGYPFNHLHVAQAVAIVDGETSTEAILKQISIADYYPAATLVEDEPSLSAAVYTLYAGPGKNFPRIKDEFPRQQGGRLLLRQGDWHLLLARERIGWINHNAEEATPIRKRPTSAVAGRWKWSANCASGPGGGIFYLRETSPGEFSGEFGNTNSWDVGVISNGKVRGQTITFESFYSIKRIWTATSSGSRMSGSFTGPGSCTFSARKET